MESCNLAAALLLLCSLCSSSPSAAATATGGLPQNETNVLLDLSGHLPGNGWNTTADPCSWIPVTCSPSPSPHVTALSLSGAALSSAAALTILCRLPLLHSLDLSLNTLSSAPLAGCSALRSLNLSSNRLSGELPSLPLPSLRSLDLSFNSLAGAVTTQLSSLTQLKSLNLSSNRLSGDLPDLKDAALEELVLAGNSFTGRIPDLRRHPNLTLLDLSVNSLSGSVPESIAKLDKLHTLLLSSNNLTGGIPAGLAGITSLERFAANQNNLSGNIPFGITNYTRVLDLSYNNLSGELPSGIFSSPALESLDLTANRLEGSIPIQSSPNSSYRLYRLRLGQNFLVGVIPGTIGKFKSLTYLELDGNELDSEIPRELEGCENLTLLNLASNRLSGVLPVELGRLRQLVVMKLQMNSFDGEIPGQLFELANLNTLNISWNSLTGKIPDTVSGLQKLSTLNLEGNRLSGPLPGTISQLQSLIELELGNNQLTGMIPIMPVTLTTALNLSSNQLSGYIPSNLGNLVGLEILDLSNNNFTGDVPSALTRMTSLTQLVLSNNQLFGVLPHFRRWVAISAAGNKDLLAPAPDEDTPTSSRRKNRAVLLIIVGIVSALVGFGSVAAILVVLSSRRDYRVEHLALESGENTPQIVNRGLLTSNSIHKSSIDFTRALEAISNPGNVMLKTRFTTYYKADMPNGMSYSVKKINWSDKTFHGAGRHGQLRQELEYLGRLSSSNVMVPLAHVLTLDSAYLFYEQVHKGTVYDFLHRSPGNADLDWSSRYSIALGVAQGLAFLHGSAQPVLLLDLTSKSIHLKSLKEPQIGDIELSKVIDPTKSTWSLSTVAGSVGYIPPEYAYTMRVTMSGNVYSFGVILLELLTGKPPVSDGIELAKWALGNSARVDQREQVLDPRLLLRASPAIRRRMLSVLKVALGCVSFSPDARPKARNTLRMLFNAR